MFAHAPMPGPPIPSRVSIPPARLEMSRMNGHACEQPEKLRVLYHAVLSRGFVQCTRRPNPILPRAQCCIHATLNTMKCFILGLDTRDITLQQQSVHIALIKQASSQGSVVDHIYLKYSEHHFDQTYTTDSMT